MALLNLDDKDALIAHRIKTIKGWTYGIFHDDYIKDAVITA